MAVEKYPAPEPAAKPASATVAAASPSANAVDKHPDSEPAAQSASATAAAASPSANAADKHPDSEPAAQSASTTAAAASPSANVADKDDTQSPPKARDGDPDLPTQIAPNTSSGAPLEAQQQQQEEKLQQQQEEKPQQSGSPTGSKPSLEANESTPVTQETAGNSAPQPQPSKGTDVHGSDPVSASDVPPEPAEEPQQAVQRPQSASDSDAAEDVDLESPSPGLPAAAEASAHPGASVPQVGGVEAGQGAGKGQDEGLAQKQQGGGSTGDVEQAPQAAAPQQGPDSPGKTAEATDTTADAAGGAKGDSTDSGQQHPARSSSDGAGEAPAAIPVAAAAKDDPDVASSSYKAKGGTDETEGGLLSHTATGAAADAQKEDDATLSAAAGTKDSGADAGEPQRLPSVVTPNGAAEAEAGPKEAPGKVESGSGKADLPALDEGEDDAVDGGPLGGKEMSASGSVGIEEAQEDVVDDDGLKAPGAAGVGEQAAEGNHGGGGVEKADGEEDAAACPPAAQGQAGLQQVAGEEGELAAAGSAGDGAAGKSAAAAATAGGRGEEEHQVQVKEEDTSGGKEKGGISADGPATAAPGGKGDADTEGVSTSGNAGRPAEEATSQGSRPSSPNSTGTAAAGTAAATGTTTAPTAAVNDGGDAHGSGAAAENVDSSGGSGHGGSGDYTVGEEEEEGDKPSMESHSAGVKGGEAAVGEETKAPQGATSGGSSAAGQGAPPHASDEEEEEEEDDDEEHEEEDDEEGEDEQQEEEAKGAQQQSPPQTPPAPPVSPPQQPQVVSPVKGPAGVDLDEDEVKDDEEGDDEEWEDEEEEDEEAPASQSTPQPAAAAPSDNTRNDSSGSPSGSVGGTATHPLPSSSSSQHSAPRPPGQQQHPPHPPASCQSPIDSGASAVTASNLLPPITSKQVKQHDPKQRPLPVPLLPRHQQQPRQKQPNQPKPQKQKQGTKPAADARGKKEGSSSGGGGAAAAQGLRNAVEGDDPDPDSITKQYLKLLRAGALQRPSTAPTNNAAPAADPSGDLGAVVTSVSDQITYGTPTGADDGGGGGGGGGGGAPSVSWPPTSRPSSRTRTRSHSTLPSSHVVASRSHSGSMQMSAAAIELARLQARTAWEVAPLPRRTSTPLGSDGPYISTGDGAASDDASRRGHPPGGGRLLPPLSLHTSQHAATGSEVNSPHGGGGGGGVSPSGVPAPSVGGGSSAAGPRSSHLKALRPDPPGKAFSPHPNVSMAPYAKMHTPGPGAYSPAVFRRGDSSDVGGGSFGGGSPPRAWGFGSARQRPGHVCLPHPSQSPGPVYLPSKDAVSTLNNVITHKFDRLLPGGRYSLTAGIPSNAPVFNPGPGAYQPGTTPAGDALAPGGSGTMPAFSFAHTPKLLTPALNGAALPVLSKEHVREYYGSLSPGPTAYSPDTSPTRTRSPSYSVAGRRPCWFDPPELSPGPVYKPNELDRTGRHSLGDKPHAVVGNGPKFYDPNEALSASAWLSLNHARRANYGAYSPGPIYLPNDQPQAHVRTPALGAGHVDRFFNKLDQPGRIQ